jgi:Glycosidases
MNKEKIIIYQILPRLFGNVKLQNKTNGSMEENGCGKMSAFSPKVLKDIKSMGFTHIWYTGLLEHATQTDYLEFQISKDHPAIVKGKAGSPYAIKDYYDIDPDLADQVPNRMKEFEALVERTHQGGLKVIIDFVPNHVARQYRSDAKPQHIKDLGEDDNIRTTFDANNNFYYIPGRAFRPEFSLDSEVDTYYESPAKVTGNDCFSASPGQNDWYETIKLNYGIDYLNGKRPHFDPIPDTWHKMRDILLFWASKNVDGFRCDMAEMIPVEFWNWIIPEVKQHYPEIIFIAEVYNPEQYRSFLHVGKFDYLYDKVGLYDTLRNVICGFQPASDISRCWQTVGDIQSRMLYFLENHDEQRIASDFFIENPKKAIPALGIISCMNTNPLMIYAGQELGERGMDAEGFSGRDGRTTIFDYWSVDSLRRWFNEGKVNTELLNDDQISLRDLYSSILRLTNTSKAIREGLFYDLMYVNPDSEFFSSGKQFAFLRKCENELVLVVANFEDEDRLIRIFIPAHAFEYFQIGPEKVTRAKDLLADEEVSADIRPNQSYEVDLKSNGICILEFSLKN